MPDMNGVPVPQKRRWLRWVAAMVLLSLTASLATGGYIWFAGAPERQFTVGHETTFITEPLQPNGMVDYVVALEEILGPPPPRESNAAVLLFSATFPEIPPDGMSESPWLVSLRTALDPERRPPESFLPWDDFLDLALSEGWISSEEKADLEWRSRPFGDKGLHGYRWSREDEPIIARWIDRNDVALALVVEASRQPNYWVPLLAGSEPPRLMTTLLPMTERVRWTVRCLCVRAMNRLAERDFEGAWSDVLAGFHLASLLQRNSQLLSDQMYAAGCLQYCAGAAHEVLLYADFDARRLREMFGELEAIRLGNDVPSIFSVNERLVTLDTLQAFARPGGSRSSRPSGFDLRYANFLIDWDAVTRETNRLYDEVGDALAIESYPDMRSALVPLARTITQNEPVPIRKRIEGFWGERAQLQRNLSTTFFPAFLGPSEHRFMNNFYREFLLAVLMLRIRAAEGAAVPPTWDGVAAAVKMPVPTNPYDEEPFPYVVTESGFQITGKTYSVDPVSYEMKESPRDFHWPPDDG